MTLGRRPVGGGLAHQSEVVAYPQTDEWLVRCWNCPYRYWTEDESEADEIARGHRHSPEKSARPVQIHVVVAKSDKPSGETRMRKFESGREALAFIEGSLFKPGWQGFSFAYLTGYRSPKFLLKQLEGTQVIEFDEGPKVTIEPKLKTAEALDDADIEHALPPPLD